MQIVDVNRIFSFKKVRKFGSIALLTLFCNCSFMYSLRRRVNKFYSCRIVAISKLGNQIATIDFTESTPALYVHWAENFLFAPLSHQVLCSRGQVYVSICWNHLFNLCFSDFASAVWTRIEMSSSCFHVLTYVCPLARQASQGSSRRRSTSGI